MVFAIVLTGGIGSGKTTASDRFGELGADVIDTDEISRNLTGIGQPAVAQIADRLGSDVANTDGSLNRARMREIAFSDPNARRTLESILHPLIGKEVQRRLDVSPGPYALVVIPLVSPSGDYEYAKRIVVVDCPEQNQIARVQKRSNLSRDAVLSIMATQISRQERLAMADDVISNDSTLQDLHSQVDCLHQKYLKLAA